MEVAGLFSHIRFFSTLWAVACQAPLSIGFSRQESWSGLPCPSPGDLSHPGICLLSNCCTVPLSPVLKDHESFNCSVDEHGAPGQARLWPLLQAPVWAGSLADRGRSPHSPRLQAEPPRAPSWALERSTNSSKRWKFLWLSKSRQTELGQRGTADRAAPANKPPPVCGSCPDAPGHRAARRHRQRLC